MRFPFVLCAPLLLAALSPQVALAQAIDAYGYDNAGQYHTDGYGNSSNLNLNTNIDVSALKAQLAKSFEGFGRKPYYGPVQRPFDTGNWDDYYDSYRPPAIVVPPPLPKTMLEMEVDSANAGDVEAMVRLGEGYRYGEDGYGRNDTQGIYWLEKAARAGHTEAFYEIYELFKPKDEETGLKHNDTGIDPDAGRPVISGANGPNNTAKNIVTAIYWLREGAKAGDPYSMIELGNRTLQGAGVDADGKEGVRLLEKAVHQGRTAALEPLFLAFKNGWGVDVNDHEALEYARQDRPFKYLNQDVAASMAQLFIQYNDPQTNNNKDDIETLFKEYGDSTYQMVLLRATVADGGITGPRDAEAAVKLLQTLADSDDPRNTFQHQAQGLLADHFRLGDGVGRSASQAWALYGKAFSGAPDQQTVVTRLNYASMLGYVRARQTDGSWKDISDPARAFALAAGVYDEPNATFAIKVRAALLCASLGIKHHELTSASRDGATMARLAAEQDSYNYVYYARGLHDGLWGAKDEAKAIEAARTGAGKSIDACTLLLAQWLAEDSDGKDPDWKNLMHQAVGNGAPGAAVWMASLLSEGKWLAKNPALALKTLREAAPTDPEAANSLGVMLWRGEWGEKNVEEGLSWMQKSLDASFYVAGRNLAKIYHLGLGVPKDETRARDALEKCGEVGGVASARLVAEAYTKGDIIDPDAEAAARWKAKAGD